LDKKSPVVKSVALTASMRIERAETCCRYIHVQYELNTIDTFSFSVGATLLESIIQVTDDVYVIYCLFKRALLFSAVSIIEASEIKASKSFN